jgi:heme-degrading monooxygenase HmoA
MIARHWTGWTRAHDADAYEELLRETVLPALRRIDGYAGGYVLRRADGDEVQFVVVNLFASLEAVRAFAGPDYETAVFEPEALRLLSRVEPKALHYDVRVATVHADAARVMPAMTAPTGSDADAPSASGDARR